MLIQRMSHGADGLIMRQVQRLACTTLVLPARPGAVEGVLQDRQLVRVVADVVDQPCQQHRRDLRAPHPDRSLDGGATLVAGHPRHQILPGVYRLGQAGKLSAVAEKIRAHRHDDEDRVGFLLLDLQYQVHESSGFLAAVLVAPAPGGLQLPVAK